jgi:hypothetical protein
MDSNIQEKKTNKVEVDKVLPSGRLHDKEVADL